ncbi:hypothetical protein [Bacillus sp. SG-1]|uniref:hypothetical protein n=1 Tax=Bacillus sp. SG-1 TaxID=161544 RepID=UPI0001543244|nr:hypothetical protein [Bacillus sp. SG-1]EDL66668.1 hypothetical protein BSG1_04910 [Bacillus sp. SG-1]
MAIIVLSGCFYHFFIGRINLNVNFQLSLLASLFLLVGLETAHKKEKTMAFLYFLTAFVVLSGLLIELVRVIQ